MANLLDPRTPTTLSQRRALDAIKRLISKLDDAAITVRCLKAEEFNILSVEPEPHAHSVSLNIFSLRDNEDALECMFEGLGEGVFNYCIVGHHLNVKYVPSFTAPELFAMAPIIIEMARKDIALSRSPDADDNPTNNFDIVKMSAFTTKEVVDMICSSIPSNNNKGQWNLLWNTGYNATVANSPAADHTIRIKWVRDDPFDNDNPAEDVPQKQSTVVSPIPSVDSAPKKRALELTTPALLPALLNTTPPPQVPVPAPAAPAKLNLLFGTPGVMKR